MDGQGLPISFVRQSANYVPMVEATGDRNQLMRSITAHRKSEHRLLFNEASSLGGVGSTHSVPPSQLWATSSKGSTKAIAKYRNHQGAATLLDTCWRCILVNLSNLDPESLEGLPWEIGKRLWQQIQTNDLISIHLWKMFVKEFHPDIVEERSPDLMLHANSPRILSFALQASARYQGMVPYLQQIVAPNFEWITLLSIFDASLQREDWISLKQLTNIGGLFVQNSFITSGFLDEVVLKAWGNAAQAEGAFSRLKVVLLRNQPSLSMGILDYLQHCPEMRVLHLTGPLLRNQEVQHVLDRSRWLYMSKSTLCLKLFQQWYAAKSIEGRIREIYNTVHRADHGGDKPQSNPILDIISGPNPQESLAGKQDQLWFELTPQTEDAVHTSHQEACTAEVVAQQPKKLKMRHGLQRALPDLLASFTKPKT